MIQGTAIVALSRLVQKLLAKTLVLDDRYFDFFFTSVTSFST